MSPSRVAGPRDRIVPSVRAGLAGRGVRLEPLGASHAPDLARHCGGSETFAHFAASPDGLGPAACAVEGMTAWIDASEHDLSRVAFAVVLDVELPGYTAGTAIGSTSFLDVRPDDRGVEIGSTWLSPGCRGSWVNPAAKLAMLSAAFEGPLFTGPDGGRTAMRVALKTDAQNAQSRAAIEKLGATFEGVLRRHILMPCGRWRDSAYYSIVENEWPGVRTRLLQRVEAIADT